MNPDPLNYAPWEGYSMEDPQVRFRHDFVGHRYLAVGGVGSAGATSGAAGGSEGGPSGAGYSGGIASGPGGVGAVGIGLQLKFPVLPPSSPGPLIVPSLVHPSQVLEVIAPKAPAPAANPSSTPAPAPLAPIALPVLQPTVNFNPPPATPGTVPLKYQPGMTVGDIVKGISPQPAPLPGSQPLSTGQGGSPPPPPAPTSPGPQPPVPHISAEQRAGCTTCSQIRSQIDELKSSIDVEQQQQQQQKLRQQEQQIQSYKAQEAGQQPQSGTLDQQIQDKLRLLDQLNAELADAQAQQIPAGTPLPPSPGSSPAPSPSSPSMLDELRKLVADAEQAAKNIPSRIVEGYLHEVFPLLSDALTKKLADAISVLTPPGMVAKLNQLLNPYFGSSPVIPATPAPPPPPQMVRVCMVCDSTEDAVRWQAGEPTSGCHIESVNQLAVGG